MAILADLHTHSSFSTDSTEPMEKMIKSAIKKGLKYICFTEHNDFGFPVSEEFPEGSFVCNVDSYVYDIILMREKYQDRIQIGFGLEIGLQSSVLKENLDLEAANYYDFIIGSQHLVDGIDIYEPSYFENKTPKEAMEQYFKAYVENIKLFKNFDAVGHIDYAARRLPGGEKDYNCHDYMDYIEEILSFAIDNRKAIEVNTSQLYHNFSNPNPHFDVLKRYKEMGGELVTVGSDAHEAKNVGKCFDVAEEMLKAAGFKYYCTYTDRMASFQKL